MKNPIAAPPLPPRAIQPGTPRRSPACRGLLVGALGLAAATAGAGEPTAEATTAPVAETRLPLSAFDGRLVFDVAVQSRMEARENTFDFDDGTDSLTDDTYLLNRIRLGFTARPADWLTFRAQAQDSREFWSKRPNQPGALGAEGDDPFDLRLLSLTLGDPQEHPATLSLGRQPLNYGDQRLIGGLEWNNIARVFDAAVLRWRSGVHKVDAFAASVVVPEDDAMNQSWLSGSGSRHLLGGLYYVNDALAWQTTDVYAFWESREGGTDFATLGMRWASRPSATGGFDYGLEAVAQAGRARGLDLAAGALHLGVGYTWDTAWKPRLGLAWDYGTGDDDPTDGDLGTFQNLYPTNHKYYGYIDAFSWQNLNAPSLEISAHPAETLDLRAAWHVYSLATTDDAWYRANGSTRVRPVTPEASAFAGQEIDLTVTWKPAGWASLLAGYSHFFAGDYLGDTGAAADADFLYIQAGLTF